MLIKGECRVYSVVTEFADVGGCSLSTAVIVELVPHSAVHHDARLIAAVVVGLVVAPHCIAACNSQPDSLRNTAIRVQSVRKIKGKGSPYSITERRVPGLILVFGSQPVGDVPPLKS